jgi:hypothetical protein
MYRFLLLYITLTLAVLPAVFSQNSLGGITGDESAFYAQTKQLNQFFKRFNNEEDRFGNRYYPGDSLYRDNEMRLTYLNMLFDMENAGMSVELKQEFIDTVTNSDSAIFLDFHGPLWFAELATTFDYYKNQENLILFLKLEQENLGYKWVITNVYFDKFLRQFYKGEEDKIQKSFLHPMSHELDFMNLYKAFKKIEYVEYYASKDFRPDYISLLMYEIKMGNMKFKRSGQLKFHFFQIDGWYFEVTYINRQGNNSGWLISKLYKITQEEKEQLIKFYLP